MRPLLTSRLAAGCCASHDTGLLYHGGFDASVLAAGGARRWLLVNVQEPTEFSCSLLNRDVWQHARMKRLLEGPLLLTQLVARSAEGVRYKTLYQARREPHIAIIDPRTRQKMWSWSAQRSHHTAHSTHNRTQSRTPIRVTHCAAPAWLSR